MVCFNNSVKLLLAGKAETSVTCRFGLVFDLQGYSIRLHVDMNPWMVSHVLSFHAFRTFVMNVRSSGIPALEFLQQLLRD